MIWKKQGWGVPVVFLLATLFLVPTATRQACPSEPFSGLYTIALDPGHGGDDFGAVGPSGLAEKDVTLVLARHLEQNLTGTYKVHLTREGDYWLDVERRTAFANHYRCDVFVSVHAGGSFHHKARGMSVLYYDPGAVPGVWLEQEQGVAESGGQLRPWDRIHAPHARKSRHLARLVHQHLAALGDSADTGLENAPLLVLKGADMPAIVVEIGYVSHPSEEKRLQDDRVLARIAEAIAGGVREYLAQTGVYIQGKGMIEEDLGPGRGAAW